MDTPAFAFVFPNVLNGRLFAGCDYHLGAAYIRAFLSKHHIVTVQYLDDGRHSVSETARRIIDCGAALIGFSCYDANYHMVRVLASEIRGPSSTFSDQIVMDDCPAIDICCRSYAEETALELVEWRKGRLPLEKIDGITFRSSTGTVRSPDRKQATRNSAPSGVPLLGEAGFRETGGTLDDYPDPYVAGFLPPDRVSDIGLVTSRGCTYSCTFCNFSAMSGWSIATHSIAYQLSVFRYLEAALDGSQTLVTINDDNFSLQGKRFHELLRRMGNEKYQNLSFWAEMRTEPLTEETFQLLKYARFIEINFGLESAEPRVLAAMKKVRSTGWDRDNYAKEKRFLDRVKWAVGHARTAGIRTTLSVILGAPGETFEDGLKTLAFVRDVQADGYSHNFMVVGDGTELADNYESYGLKSEYPADRVLPSRTTVSYDVYRLPILPNDRSWLPMSSFEMRQVSFLHSGVGQLQRREILPMGYGRGGSGRQRQSESDLYQPVVLVAEAAVDEALCAWLRREFPLNMSLWLKEYLPGSREQSQRLMNTAGVPVPELNAIRLDRADRDSFTYRINEFSMGAPDFNTRSLRSRRVSTSTLDDIGTGPESLPKRQANILRVEHLDDLNAFESWKSHPHTWNIPASIAAARVDIEDSCKWCSGGCPAKSLNRMIIHDDQSITTCHSGDVIGWVGETLETLEIRIGQIQAATELHRGCASCPVQESCAKCLFTAPLTPEEYCARKRDRQDETTLMDGFVALRALLDNGALSLSSGNVTVRPMLAMKGSTIENGGFAYPADEFIFIDQGDGLESLLFSQRANLSLRLTSDGATALRALI
jgi:radical SAM superfamily enzyme YgiQ (UPF0313 family)